MAGIYVHIPYCRQACSYCDFYFTTNTSSQETFTDAVLREAERYAQFAAGESYRTLYYGGGTPAYLEDHLLVKLTQGLRQIFKLDQLEEFTVECNPDDITAEKLDTLLRCGATRLSVGVQSFTDAHLKMLNRSHSAAAAEESVRAALRAGFRSVTLDLIYGIPEMTMDMWEENISRALASGIDHLSAYSLTVESRTLLAHQVKKKEVSIPADDVYAEQFFYLHDRMLSEGWEHYELSNFAKPGRRSVHNSSYWKGDCYLGLGPSAHSYDGEKRWWNAANHAVYARALAQGELPIAESEILTPVNRVNEYLMTHLRMSEGINTHYLRSEFGFDIEAEEKETLERFLAQGLMERAGAHLRLTVRGMFVGDAITGELFREG